MRSVCHDLLRRPGSDVLRVRSTTNERPIDRFAGERLPRTGCRASALLEAPRSRIVAKDYLVSVDTNRNSVPLQLIARVVEVPCREEDSQSSACRLEILT